MQVIFYDLVIPDSEKPNMGFPRINHITQKEMNRLDVDDLRELAKDVR